MLDQNIILIIVLALFLFPVLVTLSAMCSYFGKILIIKLMFKNRKVDVFDEKE